MNAHAPIYGAEERQEERAATLSGLMGLLLVSLRVARSSACAGLRRDESQPWAERCNPFGIEPNGPAPQKPVASVGRFCQSRCLLRLVGLLWVFCATLLQGTEAVDWQAGEGFRSRELKLPSAGRTFLERLPPASTGVVFTNVVSQEKALENSLLASGSGVAAGDVDGDGYLDLLVTSLGGGTRLFLNDGKGHFTESAECGLIRKFGSTSMALA